MRTGSGQQQDEHQEAPSAGDVGEQSTRGALGRVDVTTSGAAVYGAAQPVAGFLVESGRNGDDLHLDASGPTWRVIELVDDR